MPSPLFTLSCVAELPQGYHDLPRVKCSGIRIPKRHVHSMKPNHLDAAWPQPQQEWNNILSRLALPSTDPWSSILRLGLLPQLGHLCLALWLRNATHELARCRHLAQVCLCVVLLLLDSPTTATRLRLHAATTACRTPLYTSLTVGHVSR